jgi:hypothetical protein
MITEDSPNAIQEIIYDLTWDDTVYRTFNQGLAIANRQGLQERLPGTIIEYMHKTHFLHVLAQLRKLFEPKQKEHRFVNSVPTILSIIKDNRHLWTRENFLTYDGLSFLPLNSESWKEQRIRAYRHRLFDLFKEGGPNASTCHSDMLDVRIINKLIRAS